MSPEARFSSIVAAGTVVVMFVAITYVAPVLRDLTGSFRWFSVIVALLASLGTYRLFVKLLGGLLSRWRLMRRLVLGPSYLEGTWVGFFVGAGGDLRLVVEFFEQDLSSLVIRGESFTEDGKAHATWVSNSTSIDLAKGVLVYSYTCDILSRSATHQGLAVFSFRRHSSRHAPHEIYGHSADLTDGTRRPATERRAAEKVLSTMDALRGAREALAKEVDVAQPSAAPGAR